MRNLILTLLLLALSSAVFATSSGSDRSPKYDDERFGEKKDESDKFKFVRVKTSPRGKRPSTKAWSSSC